MKPSNNPDIAVAQEWLGELDAWEEAHGLCGFDPFDVKQHPLVRAAQTHPLRRKLATGLCDLFPNASRRALHIAPTENPKAHALFALGRLRLFQLTREERYLDKARAHLDWLRSHAAACEGLAWGYPFDIHAKGLDTPANTPVGVVTAIAGQAFLLAHEVAGDGAYLDDARRIAHFFLAAIPRMDQDTGICFAYTPGDTRKVHNANLLAAEHLLAIWKRTGDAACLAAAEPAVAYTLSRQRDDGAWPYGEYTEGEPFEPELLRLVDHHHTGFVLRSLANIHAARPELGVLDALHKGWHFYRHKLFTKGGMPVHEYGAWPLDIHACAEAVLCPSALAPLIRRTQPAALDGIRWAWPLLRDPADGAVWHRKYKRFTAKIVYPRWGVAWVHRALAEYLFAFYTEE